MKFVIVALALFAVGCQAASLQADAPQSLPTYLEHARSVMKVYLDQVKSSVDAVAERVSDQETKDLIKKKADDFYQQVTALQQQVAPMTDGAVATVDEATRDLRTSIHTDLENLKKEIEPMREELRLVILKHMEEYRALMEPIMQEYRANQQAQYEMWKPKFEPVLADLRAKFDVNVEETKSKLQPIVNTIQAKLTERIEAVKAMVDPYVQEYKEQLKQAAQQAQSVDYNEVRQKLEPHLAAVKVSFENLVNEMRGMMGQ